MNALMYIEDVMAGRKPLWVSFWVWFMIPKAIFLSYVYLLTKASFAMNETQALGIYLTLFVVLWFFQVVGGVGVWMGTKATSHTLHVLACIVVLVNWINLVGLTQEIL